MSENHVSLNVNRPQCENTHTPLIIYEQKMNDSGETEVLTQLQLIHNTRMSVLSQSVTLFLIA